jgi:hypothetical protein
MGPALRLGVTRVDRGGVVMKLFLRMGTTARVGAAVIVLSALTAAPAHAGVTGSLSGYPSPAGGPSAADQAITVVVSGRSTSGPLDDASMTIDGTAAGGGSHDFACQTDDCANADASIPLKTTDYADGVHQMVVTVRNEAGESSTTSASIEIWNNRPNQCPSPNATPTSCPADLSIGSDPTVEPSPPNSNPPGGGGVQGANETSCKSPRLSMSLSQKPLSVSHGVPVLLKNKKYRFTGRLTCLVGNKRKSASKGTRIEVRNTVGGKTVKKPSGKVGSGGKITLILKYPSSRTIEFRFTNADNKTSKVRIKVRISQRKR